MSAGQKLLAGEVIFSDARDVLDALRVQLERARRQISDAAATSEAALRAEQTLLALGISGLLAFTVLVLAIPSRPTAAAAAAAPSVPKSASAESDDEFGSSARLIARAPAEGGIGFSGGRQQTGSRGSHDGIGRSERK